MGMGKKVAFIGGGAMAEAMAKGFTEAGVRQASEIAVYDPSAERQRVMGNYGFKIAEKAEKAVEGAGVVIVAVKPQYVEAALKSVENVLTPETLIVSIAAGVPLAKLSSYSPPDTKVIRVMPNTPCLVREGASAFCGGATVDANDAAVVRSLMGAVGEIHEVPERLMDAVTGVSGSGPAYIFLVIEAMSDGGVAAGLPRDIATALAAKTVAGAAKMVLETGKHPGQLKDMVTSPAGTTINGVRALERNNLRSAFIEAVMAASNRAGELAKL